MTIIMTTHSGDRVYARDGIHGCSVPWTPEAHEETNHAAALRKLAIKIGYAGLRWNGARAIKNSKNRIVWIAASGQRFTTTT